MVFKNHTDGSKAIASMDRRSLLRLLGMVSVAGFAGCTGSATIEVNGRDQDDELAAIDFGDHGEVDVRHLVPEEMSSTSQLVDDDEVPVAAITGSPGLTYEETIEFYRDVDGEGGWSVTDEDGDEEADGESSYEFSAERDDFEATISITGFGSQNVTLWIGIKPR